MKSPNKLWPILLIVFSLITHFAFFDRPQSVVFDETYQGNFQREYASGEYYFDVHPPFGRLLIKLVGDIAHVDYSIKYDAIGNSLPNDIFVLRLLPLIAGILLPFIIFYICIYLKFSERSAFLVGLLICLENSLLVQSKFMLTDSILVLSGFISILLYLIYIKDERRKSLLILTGIFAAASFSIKWTGAAFPLILTIAEIYRARNTRAIMKTLLVWLLVGFVFYFSVFVVHLALLRNPGPGDAFMTGNFQSKPLPEKFLELNVEMFKANATLNALHTYSSKWYTWPFMIRPIFYWQDQAEEKYIYLIGNPFIYWLGIVSILLTILHLMFREGKAKIAIFILVGFLANFLPFIFIGRVMFLYHYEPALVFSIISIGFILDEIKNKKIKNTAFLWITLICLASFIFFAPLTYGLKLDSKALQTRMWLSTWR